MPSGGGGMGILPDFQPQGQVQDVDARFNGGRIRGLSNGQGTAVRSSGVHYKGSGSDFDGTLDRF